MMTMDKEWTWCRILLFVSVFLAVSPVRSDDGYDDLESCDAEFDLTFVLDRSGSVGEHWGAIYDFVEHLTSRFVSPNMRISYIVFSSGVRVVLPLTRNRTKIKMGLEKLKQIKTGGVTNTDLGLEEAFEQMEEKTNHTSALFLVMTDGEMEPLHFEQSVKEADEAREYGARIYGIGIKNFDPIQLAEIADGPDQVFAVFEGFDALKGVSNKILKQTCNEVFNIEPPSVCANENFNVVLTGGGFSGAKRMKNVVCSITFNKDTFTSMAKVVGDAHLLCPTPLMKEVGDTLEVMVSINKGETFINDPFTIHITSCVDWVQWGLGGLLGVILFVVLAVLMWRYPPCTVDIEDPLPARPPTPPLSDVVIEDPLPARAPSPPLSVGGRCMNFTRVQR